MRLFVISNELRKRKKRIELLSYSCINSSDSEYSHELASLILDLIDEIGNTGYKNFDDSLLQIKKTLFDRITNLLRK